MPEKLWWGLFLTGRGLYMAPEFDGGGLFLWRLWKGGGGLIAWADRNGWGPYGRAALERWRGHTPVGTSHDVTAQKVGRVPRWGLHVTCRKIIVGWS